MAFGSEYFIWREREIKQNSNILKLMKENQSDVTVNYIDKKSVIPDNLRPLTLNVNTLLVSIAECKRHFSAMIIIHKS